MGQRVRVGIWMMVVVSVVLYLKNAAVTSGEPISSMEIEKLEKPQRPRVFTSPEELKSYLGALAKYYATMSRNRFGKRSLRIESRMSDFLAPQHAYDLLQNNNDK